MNIFEKIAKHAADNGLDYLLIGGHAVIAHGHPRLTFDVDFMVPNEQRAAWAQWFVSLGYTIYNEVPAFLQMHAPDGETPVDLMFADEKTFPKVEAASMKKEVSGTTTKVARPEHLIAMKLHSMRSRTHANAAKDWADIVALIEVCNLDLNEPGLNEIFHRYAGQEGLARIRHLQNG